MYEGKLDVTKGQKKMYEGKFDVAGGQKKCTKENLTCLEAKIRQEI